MFDIQGISLPRVLSNSALVRIYILTFANIMDPTCSWDRGIWLLLFKFNFGLIRWPPQPLREKVPKIYKIVDFSWSIPETRIIHFGARVDWNIKLSICFCEMRLLRSLRPLRLLRSLRLQRFLGLENCYWGL